MGIFNLYPYTDFHELNADWIIKIVKELESELKDFVNLNTIKYSDPIGWNITRQYEANTVVVNPATGNAYISSKPVPNGVIITDTNYWTEIYNYQRTIEKIESSIASYNGSEYAEKAYLKDSLIFYKDLLYKAMENISVGSQLLPDTNIQLITIEDVINTTKSDLQDIINTTKSDLQDIINTTKSDLQDVINTESNERKASDETINNKITLLDTDLTTVKSEVDQNHEELLDEITNRENADENIINTYIPYVTPEQFGAKGDGTTDDLNAIKQAIASDGDIYFDGSKTYYISDTLVINKHKVIHGNGAKIKYLGSKNAIEIMHQPVDNTRGFFDGLIIETTSSSVVLQIGDISNAISPARWTISNISIIHATGTGIRHSNGYEVFFENIALFGNTTNRTIGIEARRTDSSYDTIIGYGEFKGMVISQSTFVNNVHFWPTYFPNTTENKNKLNDTIMVEVESGFVYFNDVYIDSYNIGFNVLTNGIVCAKNIFGLWSGSNTQLTNKMYVFQGELSRCTFENVVMNGTPSDWDFCNATTGLPTITFNQFIYSNMDTSTYRKINNAIRLVSKASSILSTSSGQLSYVNNLEYQSNSLLVDAYFTNIVGSTITINLSYLAKLPLSSVEYKFTAENGVDLITQGIVNPRESQNVKIEYGGSANNARLIVSVPLIQ